MCICSTYCMQFRLNSLGFFFCLESGNPVCTITSISYIMIFLLIVAKNQAYGVLRSTVDPYTVECVLLAINK